MSIGAGRSIRASGFYASIESVAVCYDSTAREGFIRASGGHCVRAEYWTSNLGGERDGLREPVFAQVRFLRQRLQGFAREIEDEILDGEDPRG